MTLTGTDTVDLVHSLVEPRIKVLLDRLDPHTRLVAGYQLGYWDADGAPTATRGKGMRPLLTLLSAAAAGGRTERAVPGAAAVELAHNFSLLHDDVMDHDVERRHRPTAWAVFGLGSAILAGDALLSLATDALAAAPYPVASPAIRCLGDDVRRLIAGQSADVAFERRDDVSLEECLTMVANKTGALTSCACALGALLCQASPVTTRGLAAFGTHLGIAFQLVDDLLGVWGTPRRTGKPVLSDLRSRKKSVPVVHAITSGAVPGDAFRELYQLPRELTDEELALAAQLLEAAGSRVWTEREAERELVAALAELDVLSIPDDVRARLTELALFVTRRDH